MYVMLLKIYSLNYMLCIILVIKNLNIVFYLPRCIVSSIQSFIVYKGLQLWNAVPLNIKMRKSVYIFKRQLRVEIFKGYI